MMLRMIYCENGSLNLSLNTDNGYFEIKINDKNYKRIIFKKTKFYKKAIRISDKLAAKYNLH